MNSMVRGHIDSDLSYLVFQVSVVESRSQYLAQRQGRAKVLKVLCREVSSLRLLGKVMGAAERTGMAAVQNLVSFVHVA